MKKSILIALLVLNSIVLLGQIWPDGAPPFASVVNVLTLFFNLLFFLDLLRRGNKMGA